MAEEMKLAQYDPQRAELARLALDTAGQKGKAAIFLPDDARNALFSQLARAEVMAGKVGFAQQIPLASGVSGFVLGGGTQKARELGDSHQAARVYLAAQAHAQMTLNEMKPASLKEQASFDPENFPETVAFPLIPVLITVGVVAVAAAVAAFAWYQYEKLRIEKEATARADVLDKSIDLATSGKPVDPHLWGMLGQMAQPDSFGSSVPDMLIKAGMVIGGIWVVNETGILKKMFR